MIEKNIVLEQLDKTLPSNFPIVSFSESIFHQNKKLS